MNCVTGFNYTMKTICAQCEMVTKRQSILDHPGWNTIVIGINEVITVFSSWGTISRYSLRYGTEVDICINCRKENDHEIKEYSV